MKTLLLAHRESSAWVITIVIIGLIVGWGWRGFHSTHSFAQKGNAPLSLKLLALPHKPISKPKTPPTKPTSANKAPQSTSPSLSQPKTPKAQAKKTKSQTSATPIPSANPSAKASSQEEARFAHEKPQSPQKQKTSQEQYTEAKESIELIANTQGEHFKLYEQVYGAILKNVFYPKKARYKRLSGVVVVEFVLEKNGSITQKKITRSSGYALLDESALRALSQTQFPATPKRYRFRVPLRYG